jgi:hypothetical protein
MPEINIAKEVCNGKIQKILIDSTFFRAFEDVNGQCRFDLLLWPEKNNIVVFDIVFSSLSKEMTDKVYQFMIDHNLLSASTGIFPEMWMQNKKLLSVVEMEDGTYIKLHTVTKDTSDVVIVLGDKDPDRSKKLGKNVHFVSLKKYLQILVDSGRLEQEEAKQIDRTFALDYLRPEVRAMRPEINLLDETLATLLKHHRSPEDVLWVGGEGVRTDWANFANVANTRYDNDFASVSEVAHDLFIVGRDFLLVRHAYDGSGEWRFISLSQKKYKQIKLRAVTQKQGKTIGTSSDSPVLLKELNGLTGK